MVLVVRFAFCSGRYRSGQMAVTITTKVLPGVGGCYKTCEGPDRKSSLKVCNPYLLIIIKGSGSFMMTPISE